MGQRTFISIIAAVILLMQVPQAAYAGPVGGALDEAGMSEQVQNAGDALANSLAAAATKGKSVRGASGALGELVVNSGSLICNAWIISFRQHVLGMVIESTSMDGDELTAQLKLIQESQDFMTKLELECTKVGFIGIGGEDAGDDDDETGDDDGDDGDDGDDDDGGEPDDDSSAVDILPGETIADAICRHRCYDLYRAMVQADRDLRETAELFKGVAETAAREKAKVAELEAEIAAAQAALEAANKVLETPVTGSPTPAQVEALTRASRAREAAERALSDLKSKLEQQQAKADKAQETLEIVQRTLERRIAEAESATRAYYDCLRHCLDEAAAAGEATTLTIPEAALLPKDPRQPIEVGPNNKVGSGAYQSEKIKGVVIGKLRGLLGGGGGSKSSGPKTRKDRIKKRNKTGHENAASDTAIRAGAHFRKGEFTVSAELLKSPDNGTFQTIYLQDAEGRRLMPSGYDLYKLYRNWSLTVSWTKDTYVDGQQVAHEAGGWQESWTEDMGEVANPQDGSTPESSAWHQLGFSNASHGARSIGARFALDEEALMAAPINVVVHISRPGEDPVMTTPFLFEAAWEEGAVTLSSVEAPLYRGY